MATNKQKAAPSLNVYKQVAVIRHPDDHLTYEDPTGKQKSVSVQELGDAISNAVSGSEFHVVVLCFFFVTHICSCFYRHHCKHPNPN